MLALILLASLSISLIMLPVVCAWLMFGGVPAYECPQCSYRVVGEEGKDKRCLTHGERLEEV